MTYLEQQNKWRQVGANFKEYGNGLPIMTQILYTAILNKKARAYGLVKEFKQMGVMEK